MDADWKKLLKEWALYAFFLRAILFFIDNTPRFFLGDSGAYLATTAGGYLPADRSWSYGLIVDLVFYLTNSLSSLLMMQVAFVSLAVGIVMTILEARLNIRNRGTLFGVFLLVSLNPLLIYYERAVLTEAISVSVFTIIICLYAQFYAVKNNGVAYLGLVLMLVYLLISLRAAYLLAILCTPILFFIVHILCSKNSSDRTCSHYLKKTALLSLTAFIGVQLYAYTNSYLFNREPAIIYHSHLVVITVIAPMVSYQCLTDNGVELSKEQYEEFRLSDRRLRPTHLFSKRGFVKSILVAQFPDRIIRKNVTRKIIWCSFKQNFFHVPAFFAKQAFEYLNYSLVHDQLNSGRGLSIHRPLPDAMLIDSLHPFVWQHVDPLITKHKSKAHWWIETAGALYSVAIVSMALVGLAYLLLRRRDTDEYVIIFVSASFIYVLSMFMFSTELLVRYAAPLSLAVVLFLGKLLENFGSSRLFRTS